MGRDRAHEKVKDLCDAAREQGKSLRQITAEDSEARRHLSPAQIESSLGPESYLGETPAIVSRLLSSYRNRREARTVS